MQRLTRRVSGHKDDESQARLSEDEDESTTKRSNGAGPSEPRCATSGSVLGTRQSHGRCRWYAALVVVIWLILMAAVAAVCRRPGGGPPLSSNARHTIIPRRIHANTIAFEPKYVKIRRPDCRSRDYSLNLDARY